DASRDVQLVDPRRAVRQVDLDRLVVDSLLGEDDARASAVPAPRGVDQPHSSSPISLAIASWSSAAGGRSPGEVAVLATRRTASWSAPVRRATSVGFADSASSSPFGNGP